MTTDEFREYVRARKEWFRGRVRDRETEASFERVKQLLGVRLPESVKWLLSEYGYWSGTGITGLDESITQTLLAREHLGLQDRYVVLENNDDGGLNIIDTMAESSPGENPVYYCVATEEIEPNWTPPASTYFPSFGSYIAHMLPTIQMHMNNRPLQPEDDDANK